MVINNAADLGKALKKRRKELGYTQRYNSSEDARFSYSKEYISRNDSKAISDYCQAISC